MKTNKIAMAFVITASAAMLLSTAARSQTYKADFATKTVLASGGTDITNTITLAAPSGVTAPFKLTWPGAEPGGTGYILTAGANGVMSWTDPTTSIITLAGDVTGPSGSNTVVKINSVPLGLTTATSGNLLIGDGTQWNTETMSGDVKIDHSGATTIQSGATTGNDIVAALDNSTAALSTASSLTTTTALSSGGDATLGTSSTATTNSFGTGGNANDVINTIGSTGGGTSLTTINGATSIDATPNAGGTITIGNSTSTTNIVGAVTYSTTPTIPLTDDYFLIGNGTNDAAPEKISQDVLIDDGGVATVQGSHAATFAATGAVTAVGNISTTAGTVSGATGTFTNLSGTTMTGNLTMGANNISGTGAITGDAITGTSVTAGSGTISTTGAVDGGTGVFTSTLSAVGITSTAGLTSGGAVTALNTADADGVNIANGAYANAVNIGYGVAPLSGTYSTTTIGGAVDFTGTVTMPSGSVSASSLALADNSVLIGGSDGFAHAQTLGTDISTTDAGAVTVKSATGATGFSVTNLTQTNGALNNTGSLRTSGGDVNINALATSGNINIGDTSNAGNINIGNSASTNAIAGTTTVTGATNINNTGAAVTTIGNSGSTNTIAGTTGITGPTTVTGATNINNTGSAVTTIGNSGSTNVIAGGTTIGALTLSSPSALDASSGTLTVDAISSLYFISTAGTVTTIAGASPASGRIVKFINQSSGVVTLTYNVSTAHFALNGSDVLLGPSGAVSLIYDGTNWDLVE
jgi:hypothetical protein